MIPPSLRGTATSTFAGENAAWIKFFAALIIVVMTALNIAGSGLVAKAQTVIVYVVLGILASFSVVTLVNIHPSLLAFSGYPSARDIISSVALTFFAFLGFGIITFTAKDLAKPARQLPKAMFLALGIATGNFGLEDLGSPAASQAVAVISITVLLSVVVHGATADPLATRYAKLLARPASGGGGPQLPEMPERRLIRRTAHRG